MFDYRKSYRHGQSVLGYTYAAQPVFVSSGIQRFEGRPRADHHLKMDYNSFGNEIVDSASWLAEGHRPDGRELVVREPRGTSNSGLMSPITTAAVFGGGCKEALDGAENLFVIHGNSPDRYLDDMLALGYTLLWDGQDKRHRSVIDHSDIRYRIDADGKAEDATYTGPIPERILGALRSKLDSEASSVLQESLAPLVRLLEYGKTGRWRAVDSMPALSLAEMTFGFLEDRKYDACAIRCAADDPIAAYALKYAAPETLDGNPIVAASIRHFRTAAAFGRIWEGMVKNADKRERASHLHDLLKTRLDADGVADEPGYEWLADAVDVVGHALGVDYAFEAYLSGVEVEHIVDGA